MIDDLEKENSKKELKDYVDPIKVIARARPNDRELLVTCLQKFGKTVAVIGNNTNEKPGHFCQGAIIASGDKNRKFKSGQLASQGWTFQPMAV